MKILLPLVSLVYHDFLVLELSISIIIENQFYSFFHFSPSRKFEMNCGHLRRIFTKSEMMVNPKSVTGLIPSADMTPR